MRTSTPQETYLLPQYGVEELVVQFHDREYDGKRKEEAVRYLESRIGEGVTSKRTDNVMTVIWRFKSS
ncbi:MAG: hypothetical protein NZ920_01125 [Aigarchaeota archaeon]|nr:hypothetical protein [Aigarchaeota archaeon]MDW8093043.1 hypothetical protein [Nitrososphaerota archaeon]